MTAAVVAPIAFDGVARPDLGFADLELALLCDLRVAVLEAARVTAESARGVRHLGRQLGLPVFERPRETAAQRRRREQLEAAKAWGMDGPSIAAQRMRGAA